MRSALEVAFWVIQAIDHEDLNLASDLRKTEHGFKRAPFDLSATTDQHLDGPWMLDISPVCM